VEASKDKIERIVVNYFEQLLKSTSPVDMDRPLADIHYKVTNKINAQLSREPTVEEIVAAL